MDSSEFRRAGHDLIEKIADYYDSVQELPIQSSVKPGFLRDALPMIVPDEGEPWNDIVSDFKHHIEPGMSHWSHPGFMAYFPASSTFEGILGELLSAAYNGPAFDWICSPSVTELENVVMDWMVDLLGLPADFISSSKTQGGGIIMDSTTESLIATMVAARKRILQHLTAETTFDGSRPSILDISSRLVALGSSETHIATKKAAEIIGVQYRSIQVDATSGVALKGEQLKKLIDQTIEEGLIPFYLTSTFGTTNSCAVDDFEGIVPVVSEFPDIWVHVDAAYAGAALACPEYRAMMGHGEGIDSISVNMGKWLLTNLDSTVLLVRQHIYLTDALQNACSILQNSASDSERVIDYRNWQLSMGRRFRALKIWFVLRSFGRIGIQSHLRKHISMGQEFTEKLETRQDLFTIVAKPQFALNVLRVSKAAAARSGLSVSQATVRVLEEVNATNKVWLSKTTLAGEPCIRVISANPKANEEHLHRAFELLVQATESLITPVRRREQDEIRGDLSSHLRL